MGYLVPVKDFSIPQIYVANIYLWTDVCDSTGDLFIHRVLALFIHVIRDMSKNESDRPSLLLSSKCWCYVAPLFTLETRSVPLNFKCLSILVCEDTMVFIINPEKH